MNGTLKNGFLMKAVFRFSERTDERKLKTGLKKTTVKHKTARKVIAMAESRRERELYSRTKM